MQPFKINPTDNSQIMDQERVSFTSKIRLMRPGFVDITTNNLFVDFRDPSKPGQFSEIDHIVSDGSNLWKVMVITTNHGGDQRTMYTKEPFDANRHLVYSDQVSVEVGTYFNVYDWLKTISHDGLKDVSYAGKEVVDGVTYDVLSTRPNKTAVGNGSPLDVTTSDKIYIGDDNFIHMDITYKLYTSNNPADPDSSTGTVSTLIYKNIKVDQTMNPKSFQFTPPVGAGYLKNG